VRACGGGVLLLVLGEGREELLHRLGVWWGCFRCRTSGDLGAITVATSNYADIPPPVSNLLVEAIVLVKYSH